MPFPSMAAFVNHINGWLGPAQVLLDHPQFGNQYMLLTGATYVVHLGGGVNVHLDPETTVAGLRAFLAWWNTHQNVNLAAGVIGGTAGPNAGHNVFWFPVGPGGQAPQGATSMHGYWRRPGLYWRPHP